MALATTSAPFQQVSMPALDLRRIVAVGYGEGVIGSVDMAVVQRAAGANMSVDIGAGEALVRGDSIANQSLYYAYNDAVYNLTGFGAAHATLPRVDRVALRVRDAFHGDAANDEAFVIVAGTATAGATLVNLTGAAAVPSGHLLLANVLIPATATTITTANIDTTVRPRGGGPGSELSYVETITPVTVNQTVEASAVTILTLPRITLDVTTNVRVEFFSPAFDSSLLASTETVTLWINATDNGRLIRNIVIAGQQPGGMSGSRVVSLAAGGHDITIRGWHTTNPWIAQAGGASAGLYLPMWARATRAR